MTQMLGLKFEDFKELSENRRIYYYVGDGFYEFLYLVDGVFIKSIVPTKSIENREKFFSDKMFQGAKRLTFRIKEPKVDSLFEINGIKLNSSFDIKDIQDEETKQTDFQEEAVEG